MATRLLDSDGVVSTYFDMDETTGDIKITTAQSTDSIKPFLDRMRKIRVENDTAQKGIKKDWWYYGSIPPVVIMELKNKGIDIFNPDDTKRMLAELNANYPYLKATFKTHA